MTRLILVRHGESEANQLDVYAGHRDFDLTDKGREQAKQIAAYLATHELIDHIYSSDLSRAYHTAEPTAELLELSIHTDPRLREIDLGDWAGTPRQKKENINTETASPSEEDFSHMQYPNGEYIPDVYDRVIACISELADTYPDRTVMISTHSGVIRMLLAFAEGYSREEAGNVELEAENASIHVYEWNNGRATLRFSNITDHLK